MLTEKQQNLFYFHKAQEIFIPSCCHFSWTWNPLPSAGPSPGLREVEQWLAGHCTGTGGGGGTIEDKSNQPCRVCSRAAHWPTETEETRKWHLGSVPPLCACVCRVSKPIWSNNGREERACCSPQREISCSLSTAAAAELQHVAGAGITMPGTDTTEREKFKVSIVSDIFPDNVSLNTIEHYVLHSPAATARPGVASSFQWLS